MKRFLNFISCKYFTETEDEDCTLILEKSIE